VSPPFRATSQALMPARPAPAEPGQYDIYPAFPCGAGTIALGYDALAERLLSARRVILVEAAHHDTMLFQGLQPV